MEDILLGIAQGAVVLLLLVVGLLLFAGLFDLAMNMKEGIHNKKRSGRYGDWK